MNRTFSDTHQEVAAGVGEGLQTAGDFRMGNPAFHSSSSAANSIIMGNSAHLSTIQFQHEEMGIGGIHGHWDI